MNCKIAQLSEYPHFAAELAEWSYDCWFKDTDIKKEVVLRDYERRCDFSSLPVSWIALVDNKPVGMVSLKYSELQRLPDLHPWLSALYVLPEYRRKGVATLLMDTLLADLRGKSCSFLYLFIDKRFEKKLVEFYEKRNWKYYIESKNHLDEKVKVYFYKFN